MTLPDATPVSIPPASTLAVLEHPTTGPLVLLLRHGARGPLPLGAAGGHVPLLPEGVAASHALGVHLGERLVSLRTSPVLRCVQTAEALGLGAGRAEPAVPDTALGGPGAFVLDSRLAWESWQRMGHQGVMSALVAGQHLPGFAVPMDAATRLVRHLVDLSRGRPGVHVAVSHDSLLVATIAHTLGGPLPHAEWPTFLEALALVPGDGQLTLIWRDRVRVLPWS